SRPRCLPPRSTMRLVPILLATAIAAALPSTAIAHGAGSSADGPAAGRTPATSAPPPRRVAETRISDASMAVAARLRETALASSLAWDITESLATAVGPRLAGSEADARAVAWAQAKFTELGFDRVWTEPVTFPKWVRRSERADVLGASAQPLVLTALGGSPAGTDEAEVVRFADLAALEAAPAGSLAGRIASGDYPMERARDGSGYGPGARVCSRGPSAAIRAGASAFLMRSAGTDSHRNPHTGITRFDEGLVPVPSAALSVPDADQLARLLARGPVRL